MQKMMSLVQSSMKVTHDDKPTAREALKDDETNNAESTAQDALILQLQQEIEILKKQTARPSSNPAAKDDGMRQTPIISKPSN